MLQSPNASKTPGDQPKKMLDKGQSTDDLFDNKSNNEIAQETKSSNDSVVDEEGRGSSKDHNHPKSNLVDMLTSMNLLVLPSLLFVLSCDTHS